MLQTVTDFELGRQKAERALAGLAKTFTRQETHTCPI